jgi:hypothetical protein
MNNYIDSIIVVLTFFILFRRIFLIVISKRNVFAFASLFSFSFIAFLGSQYIFLFQNINVNYTPTNIYILLCIIAVFLGERVTIKFKPLNFILKKYNSDQRVVFSFVFSLISLIGYLQLNSNAGAFETTQWTGVTTAFNFLFISYRFGFIISLIAFLKSKKKFFLIPLLITGFLFLDKILIGGKRTDLVYFVIIIFGSLFFLRGWIPKFKHYIVAFIVLPQMLFFLVALRTISLEGKGYGSFFNGNDIPSISEIIDKKQELDQNFESKSVEMSACVYGINYILNNSLYDYGLYYYNSIVQDFVPASVIGVNSKKSIMADITKIDNSKIGYSVKFGSTYTGFYDTFAAFSYFGFILWFLLSVFMKKVFSLATQNIEIYQILYFALIVEALHAMTHRFSLIITGILFFLIYFVLISILSFILKMISK